MPILRPTVTQLQPLRPPADPWAAEERREDRRPARRRRVKRR